MNKRSRTVGPQTRTTMLNSAAVEFKVDYEQTKDLAPGEAVHSDAISAGGHTWRINWYPGGIDDECSRRGASSMMVELMSEFESAEAMVGVSLMKHEKSSSVATSTWSFWSFHDVFEADSAVEYIGKHLGSLLDSTDGADVSFVVEGETFHAHRAVLAARSPVFRAELLGSMSEATMSSITIHDIAPATFRIMLRFMYTDAFPGDNELGDSPTEMFKHLLAAADRYALDRLKNMCAQKLWENVSVHTVGDTLSCAEIYSCPELKSKCIEFVVAEENFKKAVLTESFMQLWLKFPSIVAEVRERVDA